MHEGDKTWTRAQREGECSEDVCSMSADTDHWIAEAIRVCTAASRGDLEARVLHADQAGPQLRELMHAINHMLDMTDAFIREATASLEYAGQGKFFRRVLPEGMLGSFKRASQSINSATGEMHERSKQLKLAHQRRMELEADFQNVREVTAALSRATSEISNMSSVIDRIAGQTNLLALNSSIEAARVGAAGRGFAVVASEVKKLAQQTAEATDQMQSDIEAVHAATRSTVEAIDKIWEVIRSQDAGTEQSPTGTHKAA
ncbi:MAG: hypothetical protein Kow0022_14620 [Phycisphaerales bacterium]